MDGNDPRTTLAEAIASHRLAQSHVLELETAVERAMSGRISARHAVTAARATLATAQQGEAELLLRDVPQQSDPIEAADEMLQLAMRRHKHASHLTDVFESELEKARSELVFRSAQVTDAVAAVI